MIDREEAWNRISARVAPLPAVSCDISETLGHVLAADVVATENMPPFAASAMDGYAVLAADRTGARRVVGEQDAGPKQDLQVKVGTAVRIMTGAPLPDGADAVVRVEDTTERDGLVEVLAEVEVGENVRPIGQDVAVGDVVLEEGMVLGAPEIGLLATVGQVQVSVYRRPQVAILATGSELVSPDQPLAPGQIRNSNSYALSAAVADAGFTPLSLGHVPDDKDALRKAITEGLVKADALLTSGGVSMGRRDLVKPLLEELGEVHFGRVAVKPGKPFTFAIVDETPVFGLPGFPVSSLIAFEMFVRPALRIMAGHRKLWRPEITVRLGHDIHHAPDRTEFQRAVLRQGDQVPVAHTTGVQVSGRLKSMVGADALLRLPAGTGDVGAGRQVTALLINQPEVT
jgi:molybdenum cofactor synthesis domain-containing protein